MDCEALQMCSSLFGRKCGRCPTDVWCKGDDGMDGAVIQAVVMLLTLWQHLGEDKMTTITLSSVHRVLMVMMV